MRNVCKSSDSESYQSNILPAILIIGLTFQHCPKQESVVEIITTCSPEQEVQVGEFSNVCPTATGEFQPIADRFLKATQDLEVVFKSEYPQYNRYTSNELPSIMEFQVHIENSAEVKNIKTVLKRQYSDYISRCGLEKKCVQDLQIVLMGYHIPGLNQSLYDIVTEPEEHTSVPSELIEVNNYSPWCKM
jgi:hypothetical protein